MQDSITTLLLTYKYWIIFPLAFFEGPVLALLLGFLVSLGYLNVFGVYIILLVSDITPDTMYYYFGRWSTKQNFFQKHAAKVGLSEKRVVALEKLWMTHTLKCMFFTKWAIGLSTFLLMTAGFAKLPFKKFFPSAVFVTVIQYIILLTIGFYFGESYQIVKTYFQDAEFIIIGGVIIFIALYLLFAKFARERLFASSAD